MISNKHWTRAFLSTLLMLSLALAVPAFGDSDSDSDSDSDRSSIVGSWETLTTIDPAAPELPGFFTFNRGRTWTATASTADASTAHGAWKRTGSRTFVATNKGFLFAPDGTVSLVITNRGDLEVSADGQSFVAAFETELSLLDGTVINALSGTATGARIEAD